MAVALSVNWQRLSVDGFDGSLNDQVGYVSVARDLADHGTLNSAIIFPHVLRQTFDRNSFYMPAYYWVLASFYECFGYSAEISRVPSVLGFLLSCWLISRIGSKLYASKAAFYACVLFAMVPLLLVYTFTAMMELPLIAAGLGSLAIFQHIPQRTRYWTAPFTLLLPLLFRETGIILGVVMLALMLSTTNDNKVKRFGGVLLCAVLMLIFSAGILYSPLGAGRPSLWKANILIGHNFETVYGDAFATDHVSSQLYDWVTAITEKFRYNLGVLIHPQGESAGFFEQSVLLVILSGLPLGVFLFLRRRDYFGLGVSAAICLLFLGCLSLYPVWGYRSVRVMLILYPLVAILWGSVLARLLVNARVWMEVIGICVFLLLGAWGAVHAIQSQASVDEASKANTVFLESVVQGDQRMLVSPFWLSLDYVNEHYPQKWAFVPSNCETLRLLDEKYPVGTMILAEPDSDNEDTETPLLPPKNASCGTPLQFAGEREFNGSRFWIYRRRTQ